MKKLNAIILIVIGLSVLLLGLSFFVTRIHQLEYWNIILLVTFCLFYLSINSTNFDRKYFRVLLFIWLFMCILTLMKYFPWAGLDFSIRIIMWFFVLAQLVLFCVYTQSLIRKKIKFKEFSFKFLWLMFSLTNTSFTIWTRIHSTIFLSFNILILVLAVGYDYILRQKRDAVL
jgi:hypothetical protein